MRVAFLVLMMMEDKFDPLEEEKVEPSAILGRKSQAPGFFRFLWVRFHLKYLCGKCSMGTRQLRDLENEGECWWRKNWEAGKVDVPFWMGIKEFRRLKKIYKMKKKQGDYFPCVGSIESVIAEKRKKRRET